MKQFGEYLYKDIKLTCKDGKVFQGSVMSFGGAVQGKEDYGVEEDYISVYTGDADYVLFRSEIESIKEL